MDIRVPLTDVTLGEEEALAAARIVRSGWLTMGPEVEAFEREFAAALGAGHAVALANGTAALQLAYAAAGLGPGDELIVPALTFVATMNAGLHLGATPVVADCTSESNLTLSVEDVARKLTPRTRLIVTMAYGGHAPAMVEIMELARERGVAVVEDVCHAPLARLDGRALGTFGMAGAFSFFSNKNMATGEGGMMTTDDAELAARVRLLRSHGMTRPTWDRHRGHATDYEVVLAGHNMRMDEIRAAIGREQLKKLPEANRRRAAASARLRAGLESLAIDRLGIPFAAPRGESVHHLFVILLPPGRDRAEFRRALLERGIQTSVHYPPLTSFSLWRERWPAAPLPVCDAISPRLVTLPLGPNLNDLQIGWIIDAVDAALRP